MGVEEVPQDITRVLYSLIRVLRYSYRLIGVILMLSDGSMDNTL